MKKSIKVGDIVKVNRITVGFDDSYEISYYGHVHGKQGKVVEVVPEKKQPYRVKGKGFSLWCQDVDKAFEEIQLPKELFEL